MKHTLLSLLTFIAVICPALANDGVYYTAGNQLIPLAETDISVKKEILTITLNNSKDVLVDVYYEFLNPGNAPKKVMMGFEADPSYNDEYEFYANGVHPHIKNFTVEMNGVSLSHKNAVCDVSKAEGFHPLDASKYTLDEEAGVDLVLKSEKDVRIDKYAYVYYFDATFKPGINKVHHTYRYTKSMTVGTAYEVTYKLSPAGRWANRQIDDFTLIIRADKTSRHFVVPQHVFGQTKFTVTEGMGKIRSMSHYDTMYHEFTLRNGAVTLHKNNFRPTEEHELFISSADIAYTFNETAKFGAYYDRATSLHLHMWKDTERTQNISTALMKRVAKNLPFADRGHIFKDATLKKYFESLWWYMPDASYKDDTSDFTPTDWEYVKFGK